MLAFHLVERLAFRYSLGGAPVDALCSFAACIYDVFVAAYC